MSYSRWKKSMLPAAMSVFLFFALAGCGYTTRSMISGKYKTIYVTPFVNKVDITSDIYTSSKYKIYRPMLESDVTKAVNNKFLFDGNLKPADKETTDLVLKGDLVNFRPDPVRYTDTDDVAEYRVNIVVNISLWNNRENKLIWEETNFTGYASYFTSGAFAKSQDAAVTDAINDLARRIVERTVEQW